MAEIENNISKEELEERIKDRIVYYSMTAPIKRMILKDGEPFIEYFTPEGHVDYTEFKGWVRTQVITDIKNLGMTIEGEEEKN